MEKLQDQYCYFCSENIRKTNPLILNILQKLDEEIEKRPKEKITVNIAGNSRLVSGQRITGEDFWLLSKALRNQPCISGVDVRYNLIGDVGAYYAAKLLQKQPSITYLNLMFNDIGPEGGELIAKALHKNKTLKYLRMTGNKIENAGGMLFAAMLQRNSSLEKLDLGDCDLVSKLVRRKTTCLAGVLPEGLPDLVKKAGR